MIRDIVQVPAAILRQPSKPVFDIDHGIKQVIADLLDTMRAHHAAGLSAVQIGVPLRVITLSGRCCAWQAMVNPEIKARSGALRSENEGCMSIGMGKPTFGILRPECITVAFTDRHGQDRVVDFDGFAARVIQHEIDHLDGIMIDAVLPKDRDRWSRTSSAAASPSSAAPSA